MLIEEYMMQMQEFQNTAALSMSKSLSLFAERMELYSYLNDSVTKNITKSITQVYQNIMPVAAQMTPAFNMIRSMQDTSVALTSAYSAVAPIQSFVDSLQINSGIQEYLNSFRSVINNIPDSVFNDLTIEYEYTRDAAISDLEQAINDISETQQMQQTQGSTAFDVKECWKQFWEMLREKYRPLYNLILVIYVMLNAMGMADIISNTAVPRIRQAIVMMEGKEDTYYIKNTNENGVRIYAEPSCKADVVCTVYYGEEVTEIQDSKLWLKVSYIQEDGNVQEGWIAKRNLLSYENYLFDNRDDYE